MHKGIIKKKELIMRRLMPMVARLEAIRMLLAFACFKNFKLFQMDVKSAFLNGFQTSRL